MAEIIEGKPIKELVRTEEGQFPKGVSGNPKGRPPGSKNKITLLRQSLELQLREQAAPDLPGVMEKAVELAMEGDRSMIKLLLELHMSKSAPEGGTGEKAPSITINAPGIPEIKDVTPRKDYYETDE